MPRCRTTWNFRPTSSSSLRVAQTVPTTFPRNMPLLRLYEFRVLELPCAPQDPLRRGAGDDRRGRYDDEPPRPGKFPRRAGEERQRALPAETRHEGVHAAHRGFEPQAFAVGGRPAGVQTEHLHRQHRPPDLPLLPRRAGESEKLDGVENGRVTKKE